jgi:hypothetical protein
MNLPQLAVLGAVSTAALALAACGGGDKAPTKSEYITKADAICKNGSPKADALQKNLTTESSVAKLAEFKATAVPELKTELKKLRGLKTPKGEGDKISAIYDKADAAVNLVAKTPPADFVALLQGDPFAAANSAANAYGMKECGKS